MKRIVIACDGTWSRLDATYPTNVAKLAQAVLPAGPDGVPQVIFHLDGVGSGRGTGWLARTLDRALGGAFGQGITATLEAAYSRLDHGLALALAQGARLVLLVTGRERPSEDRHSRGAIRRKFMDWLASGPHASRIAAIRPAHQRHGGGGAVYIVLKRMR